MPTAPLHGDHDLMIVAALAADDLAGHERGQAQALIQSCAECALLHDDLRAIAAATTAEMLPVPARPRDFRLSEREADRLRGWRRWLVLPRPTVLRPVGVGLATMGLAGLLVSTYSFSLGGAASMPAGSPAAGGPSIQQSYGDAAAPSASPSVAAAPEAQPSESAGSVPFIDTGTVVSGSAGSPAPVPVSSSGVAERPTQPSEAAPSTGDTSGGGGRTASGPEESVSAFERDAGALTAPEPQIPFFLVGSFLLLAAGTLTLLASAVISRRR